MEWVLDSSQWRGRVIEKSEAVQEVTRELETVELSWRVIVRSEMSMSRNGQLVFGKLGVETV